MDEDSDIVEAAGLIAKAIYRLGTADASTPMGGLEALGVMILEAADKQALALYGLAESIDRLADMQKSGLSGIAAGLDDVSTVIEDKRPILESTPT